MALPVVIGTALRAAAGWAMRNPQTALAVGKAAKPLASRAGQLGHSLLERFGNRINMPSLAPQAATMARTIMTALPVVAPALVAAHAASKRPTNSQP